MNEEEYLQHFLDVVSKNIPVRVMAYAGDTVNSIEDISQSFRTAIMAKSFQKFNIEDSILYYSEGRAEAGGGILSRNIIEELLKAVEEYDSRKISEKSKLVYREMKKHNMDSDMIQMNMNYLLVNLAHLGMAQDESLNQNEIIQYIRENAFETNMARSSQQNFEKFMQEYGEYLSELRRNVIQGRFMQCGKGDKGALSGKYHIKGPESEIFYKQRIFGADVQKTIWDFL